jgi:hypothetical protein
MNGGSQPSPRKCQKEQQKKRQSREKHSLQKSKCPRDEEWARENNTDNEGPTKIGTQKGKEGEYATTKEQQKQAEGVQETATSPNPQEAGKNKRLAMQIGGTHKKSKAQRTLPEYMITDDDGEMIARMVQDCLSEDFDHVAHHRDRIEEKLVDM